MERRSFLKLIGVTALAPSLPIPAKASPVYPWFIYKGYKFRKDLRLTSIGEVIQIYTEVEIRGEGYRNIVWIDKEDYKHRDMYLDNMIRDINRQKQRIESRQHGTTTKRNRLHTGAYRL